MPALSVTMDSSLALLSRTERCAQGVAMADSVRSLRGFSTTSAMHAPSSKVHVMCAHALKMDLSLALLSTGKAIAYGAAMVDTVRPVRGFSTSHPLASKAYIRRALVLKGPYSNALNPLKYGTTTRHRAARLCVSAHLDQIPGPEVIHAHIDVAQHLLTKLEGSFFMLADAAATAESAVDTAGKQGNDWLGGLTSGLESILIFLKEVLSALRVPYAYGFAIILLTLLVKAATFPLTKSQVESTIAMQNLQPKLKAIQARYQGDQERIQLETARLYKQAGVNPLAGCLPTLATLPVWIGLYRALSNVANEGLLTEGFFWIPSLSGPSTLAARAGGSGIAWLFPWENGVPPLGWSDTISYLVLPVLLVLSQFVSMQIMQPPTTTDPSQKNTQFILKFLPLMIGYFSLSVPSGLSLYWLTNNILSTAQQVWLRKQKTGSADASIITAGQAKRSAPPPVAAAPPREIRSFKEDRRGEKFRELKMKEAQRKAKKEESTVSKAQVEDSPVEVSINGSTVADEDSDEEGVIDVKNETKGELEVFTNGTGGPKVGSVPKRGKRSKRTRAD